MTVRELIELNQMITDAEITIRKDGTALLDQLNIGLAEGRKPPFPTKVPKEERYIGNPSPGCYKEAHYIEKSINAWDDGKDYWQVKPDRIPKKWLDLVVYSWEVWPASCTGINRRTCFDGRGKNVTFHGERINIDALPSGSPMKMVEPAEPKEQSQQLEGQMDIMEFLEDEQ